MAFQVSQTSIFQSFLLLSIKGLLEESPTLTHFSPGASTGGRRECKPFGPGPKLFKLIEIALVHCGHATCSGEEFQYLFFHFFEGFL